MISKNTPNKLSRRNWLREVAITATGAVVLPSILTGCSDDSEDDVVNGGLGSKPPLGSEPPLTHDELVAAALNLIHMHDWITDVYTYTLGYEQYVRDKLLAGKMPTDWKDFTLSIVTQIGAAILQAVWKAFEYTTGPFIGPALAITDAIIKQFAFGSPPKNLLDVLSDFEKSHLEMQLAITGKLEDLFDPANNYQALQDAFKGGPIEFNGKKYSLRDLANAKFPYIDHANPDNGSSHAYRLLKDAAYDQFKRHIWNVLIMKAGTINWHYWGNVTPYDIGHYGCVKDWALGRFYANESYAGGYVRGWYNDGFFEGYDMRYWHLEFDGIRISAKVAAELFIDDIPGHLMNPDPVDRTKPLTGLFPRDYVYKQFNTQKTDFTDNFGDVFLDLARAEVAHCQGDLAFDKSSSDYEYKGGDFPELIKK